jgi:hypothetical protein
LGGGHNGDCGSVDVVEHSFGIRRGSTSTGTADPHYLGTFRASIDHAGWVLDR